MRADIERAIDLVRKGNPESLEEALTLLQQTVFSFSMRVCGHREDAEDTMQETLLRTVRSLPQFESSAALAVWLYKVARSRCLMSRRRSKFAPKATISLDDVLPNRSELEFLLDSGEAPDRRLLRQEDRREMQKAVLRIPPDYRMILVLHDMEELSTAEIAKITGLRAGTIRVRLHRARAFLRDQLSARPPRRRGRAKRKTPQRTRCKEIFATLSDYLDRELDPGMCSKLESHLAGCKPCEAYLASLQETVQRCRQHCPEELKAEVAGKVRRLLMEVAETKPRR